MALLADRTRSYSGLMATHKESSGLQVIEGLMILAEALDYISAKEYVVGRTGAAVDLAWFAARDQRVPLMIFEVESSASASMFNNATKVFAQDADDFVKPLFFFHVLMRGGPDNERIKLLRSAWGKFNYRVYRLNDESEMQRLVSDVLAQHRRVNERIDLIRLINALSFSSWSKVDRAKIFETAEELNFSANYLRDLACLAPGNLLLQHLFTTRLREIFMEDKEYSGDYNSYLGSSIAGLLEISLLVGTKTIPDEKGVELLANWQRGYSGISMIGPNFGLSRDHDEFLLGIAPLLYAVAAVLSRKNKFTMTWIVHELSALIDGEEKVHIREEYTSAARVWLLHIAAATMRLYLSNDEGPEEPELCEIYDRARSAVSLAKVPLDWLLNPPYPAMIIGEETDPLPVGELSAGYRLIDFPEWTDLDNGYFPEVKQCDWSGGEPSSLRWEDPFGLAIFVLVSDDWLEFPTRQIVRLLHGEPFPSEE